MNWNWPILVSYIDDFPSLLFPYLVLLSLPPPLWCPVIDCLLQHFCWYRRKLEFCLHGGHHFITCFITFCVMRPFREPFFPSDFGVTLLWIMLDNFFLGGCHLDPDRVDFKHHPPPSPSPYLYYVFSFLSILIAYMFFTMILFFDPFDYIYSPRTSTRR